MAWDVAFAQGCDDPQTQLAMNECAQREHLDADAVLNAEYRRAMAALDKGATGKLREAQHAWIGFRDKACEAESALYEGGSMQPMIVSQCLARLTRQRTEDLRLLSGRS